MAVLVLVAVLLAAMLVTTLATSGQSSTASRTITRLFLNRTCFEAAQAALTEVVRAVSVAAASDGTLPGSPLRWNRELLPPYARALPAAKVAPRRARDAYAAAGVELPDVDVRVVHWIDLTGAAEAVMGHGVLELSATVRGSRAWLRSRRTVRQRYRFLCRFKPYLDWPVTSIPDGPPSQAPATVENADVIVTTSPMATVVEE